MIEAILDERKAQREAAKLADTFDKSGHDAGKQWTAGFSDELIKASPAVQRAVNGIQNAMARVTEAEYRHQQLEKSGKASAEQLAISREKVSIALRAEADAHRSAGAAAQKYYDDIDRAGEAHAKASLQRARDFVKNLEDQDRARKKDADNAARDADRAAKAAAKAVAAMGGGLNEIQQMGTEAFRSVRGLAYVAAPALIAALYETAQVAVTASQSLALLPAVAAAAAAGIGTLHLATQGFGEAMKDIRDTKKFNEDLRALSPNAQQAALAIRSILPEIDALQKSTQDAFFAGFREKIGQLKSAFLPGIQDLTTSVASSMNKSISGVGDMLMAPGNQAQVGEIITNIKGAFEAAAPAVKAFSQAFLDITNVGSSFLPGLVESIATVSREFASFIRQAKDSGALQEFIQQGIDAAKGLGGAILDIGKFIYDVFGGAGKSEIQAWRNMINNSLETIKPLLMGINATIGILNINIGDTKQSFLDLINPLQIVADLINSIRWFVDPNYRAGESAMADATKQLNEERAKVGLDPVPVPGQNGRTTAGGGTVGYGTTPGSSGAPMFTSPGPRAPGKGLTWSPMLGWVVTGEGIPGASTDSDLPLPGTPNGIGGAYNPTRDWQAERGRGNTGVGGASGSGTGNKVDWAAPPEQWSLQSIPIGSFPGVGAPAGMPAGGIPGMPGGPPIRQVGPVDPEAAWDAESRKQSASFRVEETRQRYLELAHDNTTSETDLLKARHDVAEAERDAISAQMKAAEVARGKLGDMSDAFGEIGANLDKDLGISKGLPGIADNLVKFLASLAAAPLMGQMAATVANDPHKGGYGLMGILGAQGAFSPAFTGLENPNAAATTGGATGASQYTIPSGANVPMPSILEDTGSVPSGPQSRAAAGLIEQIWGSQIKGKIGGSRDNNTAKNTHDTGTSIDIPIAPDQRGPGGIGDQIRDYLQANAGPLGLKYTIWRDQGQNVGGGGFTTPGHQNHIDAHFNGQGLPGGTATGAPTTAGSTASFAGGSIPIPLPVTIVGGGGAIPLGGAGASGGAYGGSGGSAPSGTGNGFNWDAVAAKESSGNWQNADTGKNGHYGGLQFSPSTWKAYGGVGMPQDATREQQIEIANRTAFTGFNGTPPQGLGAWEVITNGSTAADGITVNSRPGAGEAGPMPMTPFNPFGPPVQPNIGPAPLQPGSPYVGAPNWPGQAGTVPPAGGGPGTLPGIGPFGVPPSVAATQGMPGASAQTPITGGVGAAGPSGWGPTKIGGLAPQGGISPGSGIGMTPGGTLDTAISAAASGLDLIAPGAGQAAQTGIKLANRAIQYGGQLAGIGVQGLMETFLPTGGSELANSGWAPRLIGGIAGAAPALPNIAGGKGAKDGQPPLTPDQAAQGMTAPPGQGPNLDITVNNNNASPDQNGRAVAWHAQQASTMPAMAGKPGQ